VSAVGRSLALLLAAVLTTLAAAQVEIVDSTADLIAALETGGRYGVMPGEYVLTEPVVVRHDLELEGLGRDSVHVEAYGAPVALAIVGDVDVTIAGLRLVYQGEDGADLIVVSGARLTLREADVGFARLAAPSLPPMAGRESGHGSGIALIDGASLVAHDLRVAQNQLAAIEARAGARVELVDTTLTANYRGLVAVGGGVRIDVRGGTVSGHYAHGLVLDAPDLVASFQDVAFLDNGVVDFEREAFWPGAVIGGTASVTFTGGAMRDMPGTGIVIAGAAQVGLRGVTIEGVGGHYEGFDEPWRALQAGGNARLTIEESTLVGNAGGALSIEENAALVMRGVRVEGNGGWSHTSILGSGTAIVQESTFTGNDGALLAGGAATLGLMASEVSGSAGYGLVIAVESAASVMNSRITGNVEDGVWVDGSSALEMQTSQVVGNGIGVFVTGEGLATLVGNELLDNLHAGIVLVDAGRADLRGNTIARSPVGVHLADASAAQGAENVFAEVGEQVQDVR
jgi:parallel beta-helix repeat protein